MGPYFPISFLLDIFSFGSILMLLSFMSDFLICIWGWRSKSGDWRREMEVGNTCALSSVVRCFQCLIMHSFSHRDSSYSTPKFIANCYLNLFPLSAWKDCIGLRHYHIDLYADWPIYNFKWWCCCGWGTCSISWCGNVRRVDGRFWYLMQYNFMFTSFWFKFCCSW